MRILRQATACLVCVALPSAKALNHALPNRHPSSLFARADNQCPQNQNPCNKPGIPANFCCPSGQQCIVFNNKKSAICCPSADGCNVIQPVSCDLSKQNATLTPLSQLHSTDLSGSLEKCGNSGNCCPKGFSCQNNNCVMGSTSSSASAKPSSAATSKPPAAASSTGSSKSTATPSSSSTSDAASPAKTSSANKPNMTPGGGLSKGALVGIVIACIIAGFLLALLVVLCIGMRKKKRNEAAQRLHSPKSDFSSVTANVSDPIYQDTTGGLGRTDFLRRGPVSPSGRSSRRFSALSRTSRSVRSLFGARSPTTMQRHANGTYTDHSSPTMTQNPSAKMPEMPRTPENPYTRNYNPNHNHRNHDNDDDNDDRNRDLRREPSTEFIKIYSPENIGHGLRTNGTTDEQTPARSDFRQASRNTTFSSMMREAKLSERGPYLGSPGRVDGRARKGFGDI